MNRSVANRILLIGIGLVFCDLFLKPTPVQIYLSSILIFTPIEILLNILCRILSYLLANTLKSMRNEENFNDIVLTLFGMEKILIPSSRSWFHQFRNTQK